MWHSAAVSGNTNPGQHAAARHASCDSPRLTQHFVCSTFLKVGAPRFEDGAMSWVVPAAWLLGIGWYFAICVVLGILGGRWLDGRFDTAPLFALIGTFLGLAAALYGGYRTLTDRLLNPGTPRRPEERQ